MTAIGVIPARWGSTRFPGKILAELGGKPLIRWVYEKASQAALLDSVVVATDDIRIANAVKAFGGTAVMTRADHPSGTDRVAEAIGSNDAEVVVNIQGDEPFVDPLLIDRLARELLDGGQWEMATAAAPIRSVAALDNPSVVKAVFDRDGRALFFSRSRIPFDRDGDAGLDAHAYWRHIGIYAYKRAFLERLVKTPPCLLETIEKLEQLRALHIGVRMKIVCVEHASTGVDTPADLAGAEKELERLARK